MKLADPRKQEEAESKSERAGVRSVSVWADAHPTTFAFSLPIVSTLYIPTLGTYLTHHPHSHKHSVFDVMLTL